MKILFTWKTHKRIDKARLACIKRAREIYPDAKFVFITDDRSFVEEGDEVLPVRRVTKILVNDFKVMPARLRSYLGFTDYAKFWYLSQNENTMYLDTDVYCLKKLPKIKKGVGAGIPEAISVLYNHDNPDLFKALFFRRNNTSNLVGLGDHMDYDNDFKDVSKYFEHKAEAAGFPAKENKKEENEKEK